MVSRSNWFFSLQDNSIGLAEQILFDLEETKNGAEQKHDHLFYSTPGKPLSSILFLPGSSVRYEITQAMCFCVLRLVSGHDSDGGFQHEEDNEGEGHH